jgi:FMN phosphatase YigB (HAD superfamily)
MRTEAGHFLRTLTTRQFSFISGHLLKPGSLDGIEVLSFDVFDTLLFRRCSPDTVQLGVARELAEACRAETGADAETALALRLQAYEMISAANAKLGLDGEAHVDSIHREWVRLLLPSEPQRWAELAALALDTKLRLEMWACYANPQALALLTELSARGMRLIFVSDMYLGQENVSKLLHSAGLGHFFSAGYVSGDVALLKRSGRLFQYVLEKEQVAPGRILHIGDNHDADGLQAAKLGLRTMVYSEREPTLLRHAFDASTAARKSGWHGVSLARFVNPERDMASIPYLIGRDRLGVVFSNYIHGLIEYCVRIGADGVYFLSREGLVLKDIYSVLANTISPNAPPAFYLCLSRLSAAKAAMRGFGARELSLTASASRVATTRRLFKTLELNDHDLSHIAATYGLDDIDAKVDVLGSQEVRALASSQEVQLQATAVGDQARENLTEYLSSLGFFDAKMVVLADVGWGGQIHESLELALSEVAHPKIHSYFLGIDNKAVERRIAGLRLHADISDISAYDWAGCAALKCVQIFESVCRAPHATVTGHMNSLPVFLAEESRERLAEIADNPRIATIQAGLMDAAVQYARYISMVGISASALREYTRTMIARIVYAPRPCELAELSSITNVANFGSDDAQVLTAKLTVRRISRAFFDIRTSLWREGSVAGIFGQLGSLIWAALREVNWICRLPTQQAPGSEQPAATNRTGRIPKVEAFPYERDLSILSRELSSQYMKNAQHVRSSEAVGAFELIGLHISHSLANLLLALHGKKRVQATLLPLGPALMRELYASRMYMALVGRHPKVREAIRHVLTRLLHVNGA